MSLSTIVPDCQNRTEQNKMDEFQKQMAQSSSWTPLSKLTPPMKTEKAGQQLLLLAQLNSPRSAARQHTLEGQQTKLST